MSDRIDRRSFLARERRRRRGIAAVGTSGGLLAACSSSSGSSIVGLDQTHPDNGVSTATPKPGGSSSSASRPRRQGFSPTQGTFDDDRHPLRPHRLRPPDIIAADGSVQPYLAQSVTPNADYTVWTITMRPNSSSTTVALRRRRRRGQLRGPTGSALTGPASPPIETIVRPPAR